MPLISFRFKPLSLAIAGLALASIVVVTGSRAWAADSSTGRKSIKVSVEQEPIHHYPPYFRTYVTCGTVKLAFLIPDGFMGGQVTDKDELVLNHKQGGSIVFSISEPFAGSNDGPSSEVCRNRILASFPNAKITLEFLRGSGPSAGRGFDFTWKTAGGIAQSSRVVFLPSAAGTLEFRASTNPEKFNEIQTSLNTVMGTLAIGTQDNLRVPQLSDAI